MCDILHGDDYQLEEEALEEEGEDVLTPTGELPLHLHIEVLCLYTIRN